WPRKQNVGPACPCVAQRFFTLPNGSSRIEKPAFLRRCAISSWHPPSSGVTEARRISSQVRSSTADMGLSLSSWKTLLVDRVVEADRNHAIVRHRHGTLDELRVFLQQQQPFRLGAGRLPVWRERAPRGRCAIDQRIEAAELRSPRLQGRRIDA